MARRIPIRRLVRGMVIGAGVVVGVALLLALLVFVRPLRENVLEQILEVASDSLPGSIEYGSATWPGLSRLELTDVKWRDGATQFAAATRIAVDVDLRALVRKDLRVRTLVLEGVSADVPQIRGALPPDDANETVDAPSEAPSFPRGGSIPGIPSIGVDSLHVDIVRLDTAENVSLRLALGLSADTQFEHPPMLSIRTLDATWIERGWNVRSDGFDAAVASGEFSGAIEADLGHLTDLDLTLASTGPREFSLRATEQGASEDLLHLEGTFEQRPNGLIQNLDFDLDLMTPASARIDSLLQRPGALAILDSFGRILVEAQGSMSFANTPQTEVAVQVSASEWAGAIEARMRQIGAETWVDELRAEGEGLSLQGSGSYSADGYRADVQAEVTDTAFLKKTGLADEVPPDARLNLNLELTGAGTELRPTLALTGSAHSAGLDSLEVRANGKVDGPDSDLRLDVRALIRESLAIGLDGRVRDLQRPQVHLAPVRVRETLAQLEFSGGAPPDRANLRFDPEGQVISVDGLRVTGGLGELRLDGDISRASGGTGRLQIEWPVPPSALELAGFSADARDSLLAPHWSRDGIPGVDLGFEIARDYQSVSVDGTITLPAPWKVVPDLAPEAYDADALRGTAIAEWEQSGPWSADLDFAQTAWLDSAFVHLRGLGSAVHLDSMLVRGGPVRATAAATLDSSLVDGKFQLDLHSHPALSLVAPELPADLEFMMNLRAGIAGDPAAPDARAKLVGSVRSKTLRVPLLSIEAEMVEGKAESARFDIPQRARLGELALASALIVARPEDPQSGLFPLGVSGEIDGDLLWSQLARIDSIGGTWQVRTDSLRLGTRGHLLESQHPFTFEFSPADSTMRLDGMNMAGTPGTVDASFDLGPGRAQADVDIHMDGSIPSAFVQMPARMLPTAYHVVASGNQDDLEASIWIEGINLGARNNILARVDSRRDGDQLDVQVRAHDELGQLASGEITLPIRTDMLTRSFKWHGGPLTGKVTVDSLPLPYKIGGGEGLSSYLLGARDKSAPLADALFFLGGTGDEPVAGARVEVGFPQIKELKEDRLQLGVIWVGREGDPATLGLFDSAALDRMHQALPHGGIAAVGALRRGEQNLATIRGAFPLAVDARSPIPQFAPEDRILYQIKAEPLRLDDWQSALPRGTEIGGELWVTAEGDGPLGDFPIDASIRMKGLRYRQSFGNSATLNGNIDVTGSSAAPVINGTITVPNALVRLPESERNLHEVEGDSKLWNLGLIPRDEFADLDSLEVEWGWTFDAPDSTAAEAPRLTLAESTELEVKIEIPNSFWIRGQGLDVQLAGELHLELRNGSPIVVGELRALSGQLEVVGARLQLDRGVVNFFGGDTTNPGLDLELSRDVGEVRVLVRVTGTAQKPRLAFESDPSMSQSDIMSYLLFGSAAGDLDGAQTQLLQDQAAAALSQFAAPMLENELTQSLGISMMQLRAGENPDEGLSLVVGKYVTPQILLKYEQSLKDRQKYTVNAEYWLSRNLRIETRLSESRSTGIELNWSTDY